MRMNLRSLINAVGINGYLTSETSYPVLYMPDGGIKEDFPHVANTIALLIRNGEIAPLILVGVENTNRGLDMTSKSEVDYDLTMIPINGGSTAFRKFFGSELRPEIQKRYRCNGETALVGESLAGLFVVETLITEPDLFDRYIAFDPALWWNEANLVNQAANTVSDESYSGKVLWLASSDAVDIAAHVERLEVTLKGEANAGMRWKYKPNPAEKHSTIFRAEKENAFRWALWKADGDRKKNQN